MDWSIIGGSLAIAIIVVPIVIGYCRTFRAKRPTHSVLMAALSTANHRVLNDEPNSTVSQVLKEWGYRTRQ